MLRLDVQGWAGAWRWIRRVLVSLALGLALLPQTSFAQVPIQGPGGPILIVTSGSSTFSSFYAEILRAEGFNSFAIADIGSVDANALAAYDVVLLASMPLSDAQAAVFNTWVNGGGNLIAMKPDGRLATLLGLQSAGATRADAYLLVDTSASPGNGIVNQTIQYHGTADLYSLNGASMVARIYSDSATATSNPAVSLRSVGAGKAAAFTYDLATSIVYTRQGNPAWAAQERDGFTPIRSDDKFFGNATGDAKPDWIDLSKVAIPQADEQQRLLGNMILSMNAAKKPLPRFWYFPNGKKAVVIMTGDDHGNGGTAGRFDSFNSRSPSGCNVANWECIRGTSYIYTSTPLSDAAAAAYTAQGFEISLHINTGCSDFDAASLESTYVQQLGDWQAKYASLPAPVTQRHHCIVWSDWITGAKVEVNHRIRLDTSYYYWPPSWANNVPGLFTGTAMPMRFSGLDGQLIDSYQAVSQMTDESGQTYPFTIDTLLDRAVGTEGYYGAYTINAHTDAVASPEADAVVTSALARGVPIVTSLQMLRWLDARSASSFGSLAFNGGTLSFNVVAGAGANGLQAMLPARSGANVLSQLTRSGSPVSFTISTIKGIDYAFFAANGGSYAATYAADTTSPTVTSRSPASGATGVALSSSVTATFSESMDSTTISGSTFELRDAGNNLVSATVSYASGTAKLTPSAALAGSTTYTATVKGGSTDPRAKDLAGNPLQSNAAWAFTTAAAPSCPCGGLPANATPSTASANDPNPVELGVKFTSDVNGFVTGVRFYKGSANTGTHVGNLWTVSGQLLASATFSGESATGWQTVTFSPPVAITANTTYVASYFAPNGGYAFDSQYFFNAGIDNPPIHLLKDSTSGGNGVYGYSPSSAFPSSSFQATNYWVDVNFTTTAGPDTTPPTVISTTPTSGATGVATSSTVTARFSEAVDSSTVNASTVELRNSGNTAVPAAVSYDAASRTVTMTPSAALSASTTYTATLHGGATDPRIKDIAGNAMAANYSFSFTTAAAGGGGGGCASPANPVVSENCLTGNSASEWDISGAGDTTIQGFATQISVNRGSTVQFKIKTTANSYRLDIYRLGYYAGLGARKITTVQPSASLPQTQPNCLSDASTGLIDCGNWQVSASWAVPATATSGIYVAKLVRADTGGASHIVFVVRDDNSSSSVLFQTSDTTWQAYNNYGGNSLYTGAPGTGPSRAYKVSYNRPFNTRAVDNGQDWVFNSEYPMVRWLESNGYDVSYLSGVDVDRAANLLLNHKVYLSVGHDEYWSAGQRANVEAARNAGINLAFFSGNEVFWKTRWEPSTDGSSTPYRTLVSYKETHAGAKIDPQAGIWTGTWRDPRFSSTTDGGHPENALTGTIFMVNSGADSNIVVPEADGKMRLWRNTSIATQSPGASTTLLPSAITLGYEWDADLDNGSRPPGLVRMSTTVPTPNNSVLLDYGSTYGSGVANHALTFYKHTSGARVFSAGTIQWTWGLDANHDRATGSQVDVRMQQATVNLLADLAAQPATLQSGLVPAVASADTTPPTSTITSPSAGATSPAGVQWTITGTATDTGGSVVGGVEVSVDGGTTWHPATGRASWSYTWTPSATGSATIKSRAVDDNGNLESPGAGVVVTVQSRVCPCTIWPSSAAPTISADPDAVATNVGVRFQADQNGFISGLRFYKSTTNTGTHVGTLWTAGGQALASGTFTGETASGWQQLNFATPVAITANTVYVASYLAPNGHYASDEQYFAAAGVDSPPLHALKDGTSGINGLYDYGSSPIFPTSAYRSSNYWVDVVFTTSTTPPVDTTPPTVQSTVPASGATGVATTQAISVVFSEAMDASTIGSSTIELRNPSSTLVGATISYNAGTRTATLTPSAPLAASTTYTATVRGGTADPRVKDVAGNPMAANVSWSFTTAAAGDTTPPTVTAIAPASGATGVAANPAITATFSEAMTAATIGTSTFELRTAANALVTSTVAYDAPNLRATLTPTTNLIGGGVYTATVKGGATDPRVKDAAGNPMAANRTWSFTVESTPPTVTAISPASGATNVSRTASVTATFSEAMDASTINGNTVQLRNAFSVLVTATVSYNASTRVVTLKPSSTLSAFSNYTVTIRGGTTDPRVKDLASNALSANRSWTFRTSF